MEFPYNLFDIVLCTKVLEHIPKRFLSKACNEIIRVAKNFIVIGVPYKQDIRYGRTTCSHCKRKNPPWGHVNNFDEDKLKELFKPLYLDSIFFLGEGGWGKTNLFSAFLMDLAGNPWGTYNQEETCLHCGKKFIALTNRNPIQKICSKLAFQLNSIQAYFATSYPIWIHVVFKKI